MYNELLNKVTDGVIKTFIFEDREEFAEVLRIGINLEYNKQVYKYIEEELNPYVVGNMFNEEFVNVYPIRDWDCLCNGHVAFEMVCKKGNKIRNSK